MENNNRLDVRYFSDHCGVPWSGIVDDTPVPGQLEHANRVTKYLELFAHNKKGTELPTEVYDAAWLHSLGGYKPPEEDSSLEVNAIIYDMLRINTHAAGYVGPSLIGTGCEPDFSTKAPPINLGIHDQLIGHTRIEAFIAKGIDVLSQIKLMRGDDKHNLLGLIFEAESIYVPILEAYGFHALAAELSSSCNISRLIGKGRRDLVESAAEAYASVGQAQPDELARVVFGDDLPPANWMIDISNDDFEREINCCFGELKLNSVDRQMVKLKFRKKTIGSLARKMEIQESKNEPYNIMDIFGFQVIIGGHNLEDQSAQTEVLAKVFKDVAGASTLNPLVRPSSTSPGARKPFVVQGGKGTDFVKDLRGYGLGHSGDVEFDPAVDYEVAKMMAYIMPEGVAVPCEIQFQTGAFYYNRVKTGEHNHVMFKQRGKDPEASKSYTPDMMSSLAKAVESRQRFGNRRLKPSSVGEFLGLVGILPPNQE